MPATPIEFVCGRLREIHEQVERVREVDGSKDDVGELHDLATMYMEAMDVLTEYERGMKERHRRAPFLAKKRSDDERPEEGGGG